MLETCVSARACAPNSKLGAAYISIFAHRRSYVTTRPYTPENHTVWENALTCWSIFGPVDTLGQWSFGHRGDHEEDAIYGRADGQDPAGGGQDARHGVASQPAAQRGGRCYA